MQKKTLAISAGLVSAGGIITACAAAKTVKETTYKIADSPVGERMTVLPERKKNLYEKYIKRWFDVICAMGAIVCFFPLYLGIAVLVKWKHGSPVIFTQERPGVTAHGKETVFKLYKFRTMTNERNPETGELMPDDVRLTRFGTWLRSTSLDELPEVFNILNGTMSVVGPRPQLVRDLVFMTDEQRMRHTAKPGLSGLAQINGRNGIVWEEKMSWDLKYIQKISFAEDIRIILSTVGKAFIKREGINEGNQATSEDYGDYLLRTGKITEEIYKEKQSQAMEILKGK